nr:hypothetical protein [uncultured Rhodopila sp.]
MNRILLLCLIIAGSPALAEELPVPPIPPANPPIDEAAPTPNVNAQAPVAPASERASVDVKLYRSNPPDPSLGFAPGSRFQTAEDRKPIQTPGFSITVPLK